MWFTWPCPSDKYWGHFWVPKAPIFKTMLSSKRFIFKSMALHLASLWNRGLSYLRMNSLLDRDLSCVYHYPQFQPLGLDSAFHILNMHNLIMMSSSILLNCYTLMNGLQQRLFICFHFAWLLFADYRFSNRIFGIKPTRAWDPWSKRLQTGRTTSLFFCFKFPFTSLLTCLYNSQAVLRHGRYEHYVNP